ncbi:MAG: hypothetical protein ACFB4J_02840 [Elainellaceae cyanobacterium]
MLKVLHWIGYVVALIIATAQAALLSLSLPLLFSGRALILIAIFAGTSCAINYIVFQGLIAIVDLLSRIEAHLRDAAQPDNLLT